MHAHLNKAVLLVKWIVYELIVAFEGHLVTFHEGQLTLLYRKNPRFIKFVNACWSRISALIYVDPKVV